MSERITAQLRVIKSVADALGRRASRHGCSAAGAWMRGSAGSPASTVTSSSGSSAQKDIDDIAVLRGLAAQPRFAADLYRGTAGHYDHYRLPYPDAMTGDLIQRAEVYGDGRLLDLACGTGQLAFPLRRWFSEVWAVDREPDMVQIVRAKAEALGAGNIRPVVADAESLDPQPGYFELAVIGNAFHRLERDLVAARLLRWLRPGGCVALCWSDAPHLGGEEWQRVLAATIDRWRAALGVEARVPANWNEPRLRRPDHQVLAEAGFVAARRQEFAVEHRWRLPELAGFVRSTSFLPEAVLGGQGAAFDADLAAALGPFAEDGTFAQTVSFAYELARKPRA